MTLSGFSYVADYKDFASALTAAKSLFGLGFDGFFIRAIAKNLYRLYKWVDE